MNDASDASAPAAVGGNRLRWTDLPLDVRQDLEDLLGAKVVEAESREGGFSPGLASVLHLDDGRTVFAKALGAERSPEGYALHSEEARIARDLPPSVPAPGFVFSYDKNQWIALFFENVEGHQPEQPWRPEELDRVLAAMADLAGNRFPGGRPAADFPMTGWRQLADDPERRSRLPELYPWAADRLDLLLELEAAWPDAAKGDNLVHFDIRADNVLLTRDRVVFVDWPHARAGAPYLDLLLMLPSAAMHGTDPRAIVAGHPVTRDADPRSINAVLGSLAGFFAETSMRPRNPLLPTIRDFQRAQGIAVMEWLADRLR